MAACKRGADRAQNKIGSLLSGLGAKGAYSLARQIYPGAIQLLNVLALSQWIHVGVVGPEGIGCQAAGPGLQIGKVDFADEFGLVQAKSFVDVIGLGKAASAGKKIGAHGAVGQEWNSCEGVEKFAHDFRVF